MKNYTISVNNHTYFADKQYIDNCISIGKEAMKGKNAIIGVEKDRLIILMNEPYKNKQELDIAISDYESQGFKVHYS